MDKIPEMPVFRDGPGRLPGDIRIRLYVLVNFFHTVQIEQCGTGNRRLAVQHGKIQARITILFECGKHPDPEVECDITGFDRDLDFTGHFQRQHAGDADPAFFADLALAGRIILMGRTAADTVKIATIKRLQLIQAAERRVV